MKNLICLTVMSLAFAMCSRVDAQTCYVETPYGCAVQEVPVITNLETGAQVDLIRPYWNANVDIANRRIQCDSFGFDRESGVYEKTWTVEFFHNPLSESRGAGVVDDSLGGYYSYVGWNVTDGLYSGNASLGNTASPFIELVTYEESSNGDQNNAVRSWGSRNNNDSYDVCFDFDGASLGPTGSAETGNTDLLPAQTFSVQLPPPGTPVTERPEIVRLDTGEPVEFVRAEFDFEEDFEGAGGNCWHYEWREETGAYVYAYNPEGASFVYSFPYAYTGGETVLGRTAPDDFEQETTTFEIDNFLTHALRGASFIEIDGAGFNTWASSPLGFYRCHLGSQNFAPNKIRLTPETSCDYGDADQYDGWGWNAATQQGCPPEDIANDALVEEGVDELVSDTSVPGEQSGNVDSNTSVDTNANDTGEQSNDGDDELVETSTADDLSDTTGNGSASTVSNEDTSSTIVNTPAHTSGSGATDKFLLLFLIYFWAVKGRMNYRGVQYTKLK